MNSVKSSVNSSSTQSMTQVAPSRELRLRSSIHLPRRIWHMGMGLVIAFIYMSGMSRMMATTILGSVAGVVILIETLRFRIPSFNQKLIKSFGLIMRSNELNRVTGVPFYVGSVALTIAIFPKPIALLSLLFLAFGDPIASVFGILFGHHGPRFENGKSWIGTLAGIISCIVVGLVFLRSQGMSGPELLLVSLVGGISGGVAELLPLDVDDNLSIPVVSGFVLWLLFILLGI